MWIAVFIDIFINWASNCPGVIFRGRILRNLQIGQVSYFVCPWQVFRVPCNVTLAYWAHL
jgi:hypothetical protein